MKISSYTILTKKSVLSNDFLYPLRYTRIMNTFEKAYAMLNQQQQQAVDTIEGPVMVIAGPGTGKTQILALRIAHILQKTDVGASAVLCLTFTRSGVVAMRKRLLDIVGVEANKVTVTTFHGFTQRLIEAHYELLGFTQSPELLDESKAVFLADEILHARPWEHLRPRANPASYFNDIKNLISLLKREGMSPQEFKESVVQEINNLTNDPASISSRGPTKGQLKKEVESKIASLEKTAEVVDFYELYESVKKERALMDYDDVLMYAVELVSHYEDICADLREQYHYILVDEHQDSSGIQNAFLKAIWAETEQPNIFVVGDDRQLIYGFGGASMNHFTDFVRTFAGTQLITLIENYRSTTPILSLADVLLASELADGTLSSNHRDDDKAQLVTLAPYDYSRDEIIAAGLFFKEQIAAGTPPHECALLVPKNRDVKSAVNILTSLGVSVSGSSTESLFATREYADLRRIFRIMINPHDRVALGESLFDPIAKIPPLIAHTFLHAMRKKDITLDHLITYSAPEGLFAAVHPISTWGSTLQSLMESTVHQSLSVIISQVGNTLLVDTATDHETLIRNVEVVRTLIHLALSRQQYHPHQTLKEFLVYLDRLEQYGTHIPVALIGGSSGVQVMTLHGSKGLEFEYVWIAHMNQSTLMSQRRGGFTLPAILSEKIEKKDELVAKREVYVAITRAKTVCVISFAHHDIKGGDLELAHIIAELPDVHFVKKNLNDTTQELLAHGEVIYTKHEPTTITGTQVEQLQELVTSRYAESNISVTLLNNFFECPWKWYFRNFLQLPDVKGASLVFGSALHNVLETIIKNKQAPTKKQLELLVHDALVAEGIEEGDLAQETLKGIACIDRFLERDFKNLASDHIAERSISYRDPEFANLHMYGKIDLTERFPDGSMTVTDFKTGSSKTKGVIEKQNDDGRMSDYLRQLAMYSYLIGGSEQGKHVTQSRLYFLEADDTDKNRVYSTHITREHIALLKKDIADYKNLIESGKWISQPCHFKPYGTGVTECEYCKRAREVYGE
jgi:DNA helicase II / ATP-dependent DNA helicase PcrA